MDADILTAFTALGEIIGDLKGTEFDELSDQLSSVVADLIKALEEYR